MGDEKAKAILNAASLMAQSGGKPDHVYISPHALKRLLVELGWSQMDVDTCVENILSAEEPDDDET